VLFSHCRRAAETQLLIPLFEHSFHEALISTLFYLNDRKNFALDCRWKVTGNGSKLLLDIYEVISKRRKKMVLKLTKSKLVEHQKYKTS